MSDHKMTQAEATAEAVKRWGEYASAAAPGNGLAKEYSLWLDNPWQDAGIMMGRGDSWEEAFEEADARKRLAEQRAADFDRIIPLPRGD